MILLGLLGPSGSGRDRIAKHLVVAHNWAQYRMTSPVRVMLETLGFIPAQFKPHQRDMLIGSLPTPATLEKSLQAWGVAAWPDLWRALASQFIRHQATLIEPNVPGIVISDIDESDADWVRNNGGTIWHTQSIIPEVDGKGRINTDVKYHLDDEQMLLSNPGQDVGPLVDNVLPETLARYVVK